MTIRQEIVAEALKRFKESGKKTIARAIYKENPSVWGSLESAYQSVRYATGASGQINRKKTVKNSKETMRKLARKTWRCRSKSTFSKWSASQ
jgi:PP-loop superfamily ATP-utilizing enzyme